ncbi:MAG: signal peptidase I [Vallitalea sp.]|jgi:signal peptidase I|nr:signal peptidase I [Vallitalea sp.]
MKNDSLGKEILSWILDIGIVLVAVLLITTFVFQKTNVIGSSMEPTLHDGDHVIIDKISYRFASPKQYDIIVFPYKDDPTQNYIKRIIGLPNDKVDIIDGAVYINDKKLTEKFDVIEKLGNREFPLIVPEGEYFVMGDNRNKSSDSRYIDVGTISRKDIIGKAGLRIWPLNNIGFVK